MDAASSAGGEGTCSAAGDGCGRAGVRGAEDAQALIKAKLDAKVPARDGIDDERTPIEEGEGTLLDNTATVCRCPLGYRVRF